eukprot:TRINITY_DN3580_c0_g1_i2.p2 TRINITY_DN3580_c0_g1~~TRINITY_DN3580_c0_g1_i2.p2  ORF type:complete len:58 (-),score=7.08 TRINITY_DN3580_c0_g1_i2:134-307(-)
MATRQPDFWWWCSLLEHRHCVQVECVGVYHEKLRSLRNQAIVSFRLVSTRNDTYQTW